MIGVTIELTNAPGAHIDTDDVRDWLTCEIRKALCSYPGAVLALRFMHVVELLEV